MSSNRYRTNRWLWPLSAGAIFVGLGFVDPVAGATWKFDSSFWSHVNNVVGGHTSTGVVNTLLLVGLHTVILAVPAVLLGWLTQALLVVVGSSWSATPSRSTTQTRPTTDS